MSLGERFRADVRVNLTNGQPPYPTSWQKIGDILAISNNMASQIFGPHTWHRGAKISRDPTLHCAKASNRFYQP